MSASRCDGVRRMEPVQPDPAAHARDPTSAPQQWQRVEAIFEAALGRPPDERAALLDSRCGDDDALRGEVEELLLADAAAEGGAGGFLDAQADARRELAERALREASASDTSSGHDPWPERIGPYLVHGELGRGGMGVIYLGEDRQLRRKVAIKTLPATLDEDHDAAQRLAREAQILASFDHPNVATIYGLVEDEGKRYLVLEYISGETLSQRLTRGQLELAETVRLLAQIAAGLAAAHQKGVVHRDLKPANVLITHEGQAKIVDFGIAKQRSFDVTQSGLLESADPSLTGIGAVLGTASYMSPEQTEGGDIDSRADIWAFGCVLWECLVGRRLFRGPTLHHIIEEIRSTHPPWGQLSKDLPVELVKLLRRCLQKDPRQRLRDIGDARIELEELQQQASSGALPPHLDISRSRSGPRRRAPTIAIAAAVAGLVGLALASFFLGHRQVPQGQLPLDLAVPLDSPLSHGAANLALTPEGDAIIYSAEGGLLRRELGAAAATPLLAASDVRGPFMSPDGEWIGAMQRTHLLKIPILGGAPTLITTMNGTGVGASWGDDGHIVYVPDWSSSLMRVDADGGEAEVITELLTVRGEVSHRFPHVLPGSAAVLYVVKVGDIVSFDETEIAVVDLETGEQRTVLERARQPGYFAGHLIFYRGGALHGVPFDLDTLELTGTPRSLVEGIGDDPTSGYVGWSVSRHGDLLYEGEGVGVGQRSFVSVVEGGRRDLLDPLSEIGLISSLRLSPSQRKIVLDTTEANNSLWIYDLERATVERVARGQGNAHSPAWTPDSEWVTFARGRDHSEVVDVRVDGSEELRVVWRGDSELWPLSWSPDGELLMVNRLSERGDVDLWLLPREGEPYPLLDSPADESFGSFSPDGRSIVYQLNEGNRSDLYLQSFPAMDRKRRLSLHEGHGAVWSSDGDAIYFVGSIKDTPNTSSFSSIFRVQIDEEGEHGSSERVLDEPFTLMLGGFKDERMVLLQRRASLPVDHLRLRFAALAHLLTK